MHHRKRGIGLGYGDIKFHGYGTGKIGGKGLLCKACGLTKGTNMTCEHCMHYKIGMPAHY